LAGDISKTNCAARSYVTGFVPALTGFEDRHQRRCRSGCSVNGINKIDVRKVSGVKFNRLVRKRFGDLRMIRRDVLMQGKEAAN
jgi:hypothetical protein